MPFEDFLRPVTKPSPRTSNIATAVGRHMTRAGHGVILVMAGGREAIPRLGGSHVAWAALAGLCRQLAAEYGPHGVRVAWLLSPGSPDPDEPQRVTSDVRRSKARTRHRGPAAASPAQLRRGRQLATFAASDWARTITASEINITGGAVID
jgi:NAD(P)-dependent dehydrogenase (short-subunit alcohol dehydrogenase family)